MSTAQPEDGLPVRRLITADSFRALNLKLSGGKPRVAVPPPKDAPVIVPAQELPAAAERNEPPPEPPAPGPAKEVPKPQPVRSETPGEALPLDVPAPADLPPVTEPEPAPPGSERAVASEQPEPAPAAEVPRPEMAIPVIPLAEIAVSVPVKFSALDFVERRVLEKPQPEDPEAGARAHALLDIMAIPTAGSLPQERALANDTLLRLIPRMPLRSLRHLAERVCLMEAPAQMLVRRLINDPRIEVSGPLLEHAMIVNDNDLIAVAAASNPAKLKLIARRRVISPALAEALIQSNDVETLLNLVRNQGASFSIESMWRLTRFAAAHPVLQAPLVTRPDTPSPIAFQLFWRLPPELRRYVLSRFLTDSETITKILTMNAESEGVARKYADLSLLSKLETAAPEEAGGIYARLVHVSEETGARIAGDQGGEALTVALKAAGLTRAQFAGLVAKRADAEVLQAIFDTLSFNKARVLLTYWDWAARRTGPYARFVAA